MAQKRTSTSVRTKNKKATRTTGAHVWDALRLGVEFFHNHLDEEMRAAIEKEWGISNDSIDMYKIGFCPPEKGALLDHLAANGVSRDNALATGLFYVSADDAIVEGMRGRVTVPYWERNQVRYLIGRLSDLTPKKPNKQGEYVVEQAKYKKLSTYSAKKRPYVSKEIKNLIFNIDDMCASPLIVTEGVMDSIVVSQLGYSNISPVTTRFSKKDARLLKQIVKPSQKIILIPDNEESGAGFKGAESMAGDLEGAFDVRIAVLPRSEDVKKVDAADYLKAHSRGEFQSVLDAAQPFASRRHTKARATARVKAKTEDSPPGFPVSTAAFEKHIKRLSSPTSRSILLSGLEGGEFAPSGGRQDAMFRAAGMIASLYPQLKIPPSKTAELYRPMFERWAGEHQADKSADEEIGIFTEMIERSRSEMAERREEKRASDGKALSSFVNVTTDEEAVENRFAPLAEALGLEAIDWKFLSAAIVMYLKTFYVFDFHEKPPKYSRALIRGEIRPFAREAWEGMVMLDLNYINDKDVVVQKTVERILDEYATVAKSVIYSLEQQTTTFMDGQLIVASAPVLDLETQHNPQIEKWLRLLAGSHQETLLDWIAVCTDHQKAAAALLLSGVDGVGKDLLPDGLSYLYRNSGPAELLDCLSEFNAGLMDCPIVAWSEASGSVAKGFGSALKKFITARSRKVNPKNLAKVDLVGNTRLIISANNHRVLDALANESMTKEDIAALGKRLFHIPAQPEAAAYLQELLDQDPDTIQNWIRDRSIARYALWCKETRSVSRKSRFLIEGNMQTELSVRGRFTIPILEWLVSYVLAPSKLNKVYIGRKETPLCAIVKGTPLVLPEAVHDCWPTYQPKADLPSHSRIAEVLERLRDATVKGRSRLPTGTRRTAIPIEPSRLIEFAAEKYFADRGEMIAALRGGTGRPVAPAGTTQAVVVAKVIPIHRSVFYGIGTAIGDR